MTDGSDIEIRQRCLLVGSRIGLLIHDIAEVALDLHESDMPYPRNRAMPPAEAAHIRDVQRGLLHQKYAALREATDAARAGCGWYDDTPVGHGVDVLILEDSTDPDKIFDILGELTRSLYEVETTAIRDAQRGA